MARINIHSSAQIFPKFSGYRARKLDLNKKNERSTQMPIPITTGSRNLEAHLFFATDVNSGKFYSYQTDYFPFTSRKGVTYLFILYLFFFFYSGHRDQIACSL